MISIYYFMITCALITMLIALWMSFKLKQIAKGGTIGKVIKILNYFVILFIAGYIFTPFMPNFSKEVNLLLAAVIFLFGALFVSIVLWLIKSLILKVFKDLEY